MSFNAIS